MTEEICSTQMLHYLQILQYVSDSRQRSSEYYVKTELRWRENTQEQTEEAVLSRKVKPK